MATIKSVESANAWHDYLFGFISALEGGDTVTETISRNRWTVSYGSELVEMTGSFRYTVEDGTVSTYQSSTLTSIRFKTDGETTTELTGIDANIARLFSLGRTIEGYGRFQTEIEKMFNFIIPGQDWADTSWIFSGSSASEFIYGGDLGDTLYGFSGDDLFRPAAGADVVDGGAGTDSVSYRGQDAGVTVNLFQRFAVDGAGDRDSLIQIENVAGTIYDDTIVGNGQNNVFLAGSGNDYVNGRAGDDFIAGGKGNDAIFGRAGDDILYGSNDPGDDNVYVSPTDHDRLAAGTGDDEVHGQDGNDIVLGQAGNDTLYGDDGNDLVAGGAGKDEMFGGDGNDRMFGGADADLIEGGEGDDQLVGAAGDDRLAGNSGNDLLNGAGGADTFVYYNAASGNDTILRFETGVDTIEIDTTAVADFSGITVSSSEDGAVASFGLTTITFLKVSASSIDEGDFVFV